MVTVRGFLRAIFAESEPRRLSYRMHRGRGRGAGRGRGLGAGRGRGRGAGRGRGLVSCMLHSPVSAPGRAAPRARCPWCRPIQRRRGSPAPCSQYSRPANHHSQSPCVFSNLVGFNEINQNLLHMTYVDTCGISCHNLVL